jgi:hypothetical protein
LVDVREADFEAERLLRLPRFVDKNGPLKLVGLGVLLDDLLGIEAVDADEGDGLVGEVLSQLIPPGNMGDAAGSLVGEEVENHDFSFEPVQAHLPRVDPTRPPKLE